MRIFHVRKLVTFCTVVMQPNTVGRCHRHHHQQQQQQESDMVKQSAVCSLIALALQQWAIVLEF